MIDIFACEYGWTIDNISDLSIEDIGYLLNTIKIRNNNNGAVSGNGQNVNKNSRSYLTAKFNKGQWDLFKHNLKNTRGSKMRVL